MQLWEFYQITTLEVLEKLTRASFNQNAAKTAKQMIVVVARKDLWRKEFDQMLLLKSQYGEKLPADYSKREKFALNYYQKIVPTLYFDFLGILGTLKFLVFKLSDYLSLFIDKQK
jgi:nitroreductase